MRRLSDAHRAERRRRREKGAAATIVAVLLAGGVLMGMAALTVDVGGIMYERRQLQNGADAAAMAFADICANVAEDCDADKDTTLSELDSLLNANSLDKRGQLDTARGDSRNGLCGRKNGLTPLDLVPLCASAGSDALLADLAECPPLPSWLEGPKGSKIPYVEAYSLTESTQSDNTILPATFAQTLGGGVTGTTVRACARAAWGPPASYTGTVPLTFSACEWEYFMADYGGYVAQPPGPNGYGDGAGQNPWPDANREKVIYFKADNQTGEPKSCMWNDTNDFPGGFGYLTQDNCQAILTDGDWVDAETGVSMPNECKVEMEKLHNTVIDLPVFNCVQWGSTEPTQPVEELDCSQPVNGTKVWYHIAGWAKFYLAGYRYPSGTGDSHNLLGAPCGSNEVCISGWFVQGSLNGADTIGDPDGDNDFGTYAVVPAG